MIQIRRAKDRGRTSFGWLDSRHTFSFGHYYDTEHMGFGTLRVINEDIVQPGAGFGTHSHRDMEIISYVLDGALEHRDSIGNGSVIRPGDVQRMTAGTGIRHSEFNASIQQPVHFLQIWILPEWAALEPGYEQRHFDDAELSGGFRLVASGDARGDSIKIHQDVDLYAARPFDGRRIDYTMAEGRQAWLQVARGAIDLNGQSLEAGDAAAVRDESDLAITAMGEGAEVLLFDMAP